MANDNTTIEGIDTPSITNTNYTKPFSTLEAAKGDGLSPEEIEYLKYEYNNFIVLGIIDFVLLIMMLGLSYKVLKLTKCLNHRIILLVTFMNLSLVFSIIMRIYFISESVRSLRENAKTKNFRVMCNLYSIYNGLIMLTMMFNINTWYF